MFYKNQRISGYFQIYRKNSWIRFMSLEYKEVLKICSFFKFTYGTLIFTGEKSWLYSMKLYKNLHCPSNATNFQSCRFIQFSFNFFLFIYLLFLIIFRLFKKYRFDVYSDSLASPLIKCQNRTHGKCHGDKVVIMNNVCYSFFETKINYKNSEINDLCLKKNMTQIDFLAQFQRENFYFLKTNFLGKNINKENIPLQYFSLFFVLFFFKFLLFL